MFRRRNSGLEFLLVHPGGPFWKNKDDGAWTIPKGEVQPGEEPLTAAKREFQEEVGFAATGGEFIELNSVRQKSGKEVRAWAFEGDCDPATCKSNMFSLEWPPRSGKMSEFPEVDRVEFFSLDAAKKKVNAAQVPLLEELTRKLLV